MWQEAQNKCRKMRDFCASVLAGMEDAALAVKKSKYWSKTAQKDAVSLMDKLTEHIQTLKKVLQKPNATVDCFKAAVLSAALLVKECQAQIREFRQLANKTGSTSSKNSKK